MAVFLLTDSGYWGGLKDGAKIDYAGQDKMQVKRREWNDEHCGIYKKLAKMDNCSTTVQSSIATVESSMFYYDSVNRESLLISLSTLKSYQQMGDI